MTAPTLQYLATESEIRHIEVHCSLRGCGHIGLIPIDKLIAQAGPDATLDDLSHRLRCAECEKHGRERRAPGLQPYWAEVHAPGKAKGWNVEG